MYVPMLNSIEPLKYKNVTKIIIIVKVLNK